jgi:hypothetical protein
MARSASLKSNYVSVRKDFEGKNVNHACAMAMIDGRKVLIDPSYRTFDVKHKGFSILTDQQAVPHLKQFRNNA